ncbi:MAG: hypothetical protein OXC28_07280 [Defluviicoccus sp.]|nr:hypothetical protein [Defluviicoccus sp.]
MKGWELPAAIRAAMTDPVRPGTPLPVLRALRDDVAVRAEIFPDAELARQALDALVALKEPGDAGRVADRPAAPAAACAIDDRDECEACQ